MLLFWGVEGCFQDSELFIFFLGQDITGLQRLKIVKSGEFRCHVLSFVKFFFFLHKLPFGASSALLQLGGFCTFFVYDCCFLLRVILSCGVLRQKTFKMFMVRTLTWCSHPCTSFLVGRTPGPQNGGMVLLLLTPKPPSL